MFLESQVKKRDCGELTAVPANIHVHLEPQEVILSEKRVFADVISKLP